MLGSEDVLSKETSKKSLCNQLIEKLKNNNQTTIYIKGENVYDVNERGATYLSNFTEYTLILTKAVNPIGLSSNTIKFSYYALLQGGLVR